LGPIPNPQSPISKHRYADKFIGNSNLKYIKYSGKLNFFNITTFIQQAFNFNCSNIFFIKLDIIF
jgi:hypothetical protein